MKRIAVFIICLLFALAGFFCASGSGRRPALAETVETPSGITMRYFDSKNETQRSIKNNDRVEALYNTTGFLTFRFNTEIAEDTIEIENFVVTRLGENISHTEDDEYDDSDRLVLYYYWEYGTVGVYNVSVSIVIFHEAEIHMHTQECLHTHDENCESEEEEEEECDLIVDCGFEQGQVLVPESQERRNLAFQFLCKSAEDPEFTVFYTHQGQNFSTTSRIYNDLKSELRITLVAGENFYWDESSAIYSTSDEKLIVIEDGKYLIVQLQSKGTYTLNFSVTYLFTYLDETTELRTRDIESTITFEKRPRQTTFWDVLLGVAVLGALGGAAWFMTRLSKNVEAQ